MGRDEAHGRGRPIWAAAGENCCAGGRHDPDGPRHLPASGLYEPEQLKDRPIAVSPYNGSHFTTLKMLEGFLEKRHIQVTHAGTMVERLEAVRRGEVAAANVMEPWISVAQKQGFRVIMESNSTRAEAASDDLDGPTLAALFHAQARAAALINHDPARYAHYFVAEAQGPAGAAGLADLAPAVWPPGPVYAGALPGYLPVDARLSRPGRPRGDL